MHFAVLLNIFLVSCQTVQTANIFAVLTYPAKSHFRPIETLLKTLAERGHVVDFATHYPTNTNLSGYNELNIQGCLPLYTNNLSVHHFEGFTFYKLMKYVAGPAGIDACRAIFNTSIIQNLRKTHKKYDLVITQILGSDCFLGFSSLFEAPIVSIVAMNDLPWANDRIGNPDNPSFVPSWFGESKYKFFWYDRVKNTVLWVMTRFLYHFLSSRESNQLTGEFFGAGVPTLETLAQNTSLVLFNTHFSLSNVRPNVHNLVEIGGLQIHKPKALSSYFENLFNDSNSVIYLSMGSQMMTETWDTRKLQGLFDAFAALPYKVLWKADRHKFPKCLKIPKNTHFEVWMPQIDILCHQKIKLFVTHGGLYGTQEGIYCGVPRLGIPFYADQENNVRMSVAMGIALKIAYKDINKDSVITAIRELLGNPIYKQNVLRTSRIFRDRPKSPLDIAVYWIEHVIKYKGALHLRSIGAKVSWCQYYVVDVVIALFGVIFLIVLLVKILTTIVS